MSAAKKATVKPAPSARPEGEPEHKTLKTSLLRVDGGTQLRAFTDSATIEQYKQDLVQGDKFPAIDAVFDGTNYWVFDGFHRIIAHHESGHATIDVRVYKGTRRDAIRWAAGANATHGLRRTSQDKRRAVEALLKDKDYRNRGFAFIAKAANVSEHLVREIFRQKGIARPDRIITASGKSVPSRNPRAAASNMTRHRAPLIASEPGPDGKPATHVQQVFDTFVRRLPRLNLEHLERLRVKVDEQIAYYRGLLDSANASDESS